MDVTGKYIGHGYGSDMKLHITFAIEEGQKALLELSDIKYCKKLTITAKKYRNQKSDQARKYFWELVGKLVPRYGTDNFATYIEQLRRWGVAYPVKVRKDALDILGRQYRYMEIEEEYEEHGKLFCDVLVFPGIRFYNTSEMSRLIEGTVSDCKEWGIETLTPDQIAEMLAVWKGG